MKDAEHWQEVYGRRETEKLTWYQEHLEQSLAFIGSVGLTPQARLVDVGGGAATLVDDLVEAGHTNLAVVDLATDALETSRERLGELASRVDWIVGDATQPQFPDASVDFWHDRAVCHFLTDDEARDAYVHQLKRSLKPGGYVMIATFALDGPEMCSGLPTRRYDPAGIARVIGEGFEMIGEAREEHQTPADNQQNFSYALLRKTP